jgi:hypothetical protein
MNHTTVLVTLGIILGIGLMVTIVAKNVQAYGNKPRTLAFCFKFSEKDISLVTWCFNTLDLCKQAENKVIAEDNVITDSCHEVSR